MRETTMAILRLYPAPYCETFGPEIIDTISEGDSPLLDRRAWRGRLAIATRPRGGDWLEDEARGLRAAGLDAGVSCLRKRKPRS